MKTGQQKLEALKEAGWNGWKDLGDKKYDQLRKADQEVIDIKFENVFGKEQEASVEEKTTPVPGQDPPSLPESTVTTDVEIAEEIGSPESAG